MIKIKTGARIMVKSVLAFDTEMGIKVGMTGTVLRQHYYENQGYYVEFDNGQIHRFLAEQLIIAGISRDRNGHRVVNVKNKGTAKVTVFMFNLQRTGRPIYNTYTSRKSVLDNF